MRIALTSLILGVSVAVTILGTLAWRAAGQGALPRMPEHYGAVR